MINLMVKPTEVSAKAKRRQFSTAEKIRILRDVRRIDLVADADRRGDIREGSLKLETLWRSRKSTHRRT
jgi:hypothetical protein